MLIKKGHFVHKKILNENAIVYNKFSGQGTEVNVFKASKGFNFSFRLTGQNAVDVYWLMDGQLKRISDGHILLAMDTFILTQEYNVIVFEALEDTEIYCVSHGGKPFEMTKSNFDYIDEIMGALQNKDHYTKEHCERVCKLAKKMVPYLNLSEEEVFAFSKAAKYHDLGKIDVSDEILNKPDRLTESEYESMKAHVDAGAQRLIERYGEKTFRIVSEHHERLDGSGYPLGLKEDEISELGKALAVIDTFDAMTTNRIYKVGKSNEEAFEELYRLADKQYKWQYIEILEKIVCNNDEK